MAANRDERMKEITDRLQAGLEELFNSEKYAEYLRVMSQFHHYSFNNTLLIAMQKPDATLVAGYHAWDKKFNRHVMKGEKGIQIIAPAPIREKQEQEKVDPDTGEVVLGENGQPETEEVTITIPRFKVSTVFDLSQTDGDPLPELGVEELTASVENYEIFMEAIRNVAPVPVRFDEIASGAKGYYSNTDKEIVIQSGMGEMQTMKTAVHETAHAILHDKDIMQEQGIQKDQMTREVEAESVAFATLAHFELDTSEYSFPYIAGWSSGRDTKELKSSLDTIRRTASEIIDGIEASMREQLLERQEQTAALTEEVDVPGREELLSEKFQEITLFDVPMIYSNGRIDRAALPEGIYCYDLRGSDYDPGSPIQIEDAVTVNHAASVLSAFPIDVSEPGNLRLGEELNFEGGEVTLSEYIEMTGELDSAVQAEKLENAIGRANENLYLDGKGDRYAIYQLKEGEDYRDLRFMNTEYLANNDLAVDGENYNYIYGGRLPEGETLDGIYERFNLRHPEGYTGHSLSVSDMVIMQRDGEARAYYVDSFGFTEIDEFVEQRQRITEKQHRIEDAYINDDSLGIIVDGHEGTWQTIEGQEIGGEMFYLMESQEYGDEAANILLHMDGDLVAEDLWNGIDYGAMQAVKEYFDEHGIEYSPVDFPLRERYSIGTEVDPSGKVLFFVVDNVTGGPQGDHGEVKLYDDRTELLEQVRSMNRDIQGIYRESSAYAREHGQIDAYRISRQENNACKDGIEHMIRENFDGMHLNPGVIKPVIDRFGAERIAYVLANTVQNAEWDQRYSRSNKEWAAKIMKGEDDSTLLRDLIMKKSVRELPASFRGIVLKDDADSPYGGTSHSSETLDEFIQSAEIEETVSVAELSESLKSCGIESPFEFLQVVNRFAFYDGKNIGRAEDMGLQMDRRTSFLINSHPAVLDGFVSMFRKELTALGLKQDVTRPMEKPFIDYFYVVDDLEVKGPLAIKRYDTLDAAIDAYFALPNDKVKALGIQNTKPLPGSLDFIQCENGIDTATMDYTSVEVWNNPEIQAIQADIDMTLALHDTEIAYEMEDGFFVIQNAADGFDYSFYDKDYHLMDGGLLEDPLPGDLARTIKDAANEILVDRDKSLDDCKVVNYEDFCERVETVEQAEVLEAQAAQEIEVTALAIGHDTGFITVERTEAGYDYTIFNTKCRPLDSGVLTNIEGSIQNALNEVMDKEGIDPELTWVASFDTILAEAGEAELPPKAPSLTYYVAECMEFPVLGEYHEVDTIAEAVQIYEQIPADRMNGIKGIGFNLDDGSDYAGAYPLMEGGKVASEMIDLVEHYKNSPLVQQAVAEIQQYYPDARETEYQPREAEETAPAVTQISVEAAPVEKTEQAVKQSEKVSDAPEKNGNEVAGGRRESVLKALRERQAQIKEREKNAPEQKNHDRKKGEQSL